MYRHFPMTFALFVIVLAGFFAPTEATAAAAPVVEDRAAYMVRCKRETMAAYPTPPAQADSICSSRWDEIVAARPMAAALFAVAPAPGTAFNADAAKRQIGTLRDIEVMVTGAPKAGVSFSWFKNGDVIPFNLEESLRVRGALVAMIACQQFGVSEGTHIYRAALPGKAPFALTVSFRNAAVASHSSDYNVSADFSGLIPTLAGLNRNGEEYTATCPQ